MLFTDTDMCVVEGRCFCFASAAIDRWENKESFLFLLPRTSVVIQRFKSVMLQTTHYLTTIRRGSFRYT